MADFVTLAGALSYDCLNLWDSEARRAKQFLCIYDVVLSGIKGTGL